MRTFGVMLDADVLFAAPVRDTLLHAAEVGLYRPHWSDAVLEEVRRNLVEKRRTSEEQAARLIETIREAFPEARVTGFERLIASMTNHPKDRHVLAAAVRARAQLIVTSNLKDFPDDALKDFEIEAQAPDEFLLNLLDLEPNRMVQVVIEQARALHKKPMNVYQVLDRVGLHAPGFAEAMRQALAKRPKGGDAVIRYLPAERHGA
jgi:predicted nucleic acid-binding protein